MRFHPNFQDSFTAETILPCGTILLAISNKLKPLSSLPLPLLLLLLCCNALCAPWHRLVVRRMHDGREFVVQEGWKAHVTVASSVRFDNRNA